MTETTDQTAVALAEQIGWQRQAAALLGKLLELAAKQHLPAVNWTVGSAGATLHGECNVYPRIELAGTAAARGLIADLRRECFTTWREAISAVTTTGPDGGYEHVISSEETRLIAEWERLPIDLNPRWRDLRPGSRAPSVHVVLTASIWPADDEEG